MMFDGLNKRADDPKFDYIIKTLDGMNERIEKSHIENREERQRHLDNDHRRIEEWEKEHSGQGSDTPHAIIEKRLSAHSKRFWWLSGAGAAIGAGFTAFIEWARK
jgi:hypothetical protein